MTPVALIIAAYLIGSIPFGLLVARAKGVDIRAHGSGNIGATNVGRVLGRSYGILVFALDLLKGLLPTLPAGKIIEASSYSATTVYILWLVVGAACILGHMFPIYLRFRGGKGVATSLGVLLGIYPYFTIPVLIAFGLWVAVTLTTRYVSAGSVAAAVAMPVLFALTAHLLRESWGPPQHLWPLYVFAVILAGLVVYRHRSNLQRLAAGTESKIGRSREAAPPAAQS